MLDQVHLFDTNIVIDMLKKKEYKKGAISIITVLEVVRGMEKSRRKKVKQLLEESFEVLNIDNKTIITYSELYTKLKESGEMIPEADLLIGATAISNYLKLKSNDKHFETLEKHDFRIEKYN